jgi:hypothetical protein
VTKAHTLVLVVLEDGRPGRALASCAGSIVIGRDPSCDLVLPDPSVSGRHAEVKAIGDKHIIDDLESDAGILVAGRRVEFHVLGPGDRIQIGACLVEYLEDESLATPEAKPAGWTMDVVTYRELVERQGSIRLDVGLRLAATIVSEDDPSLNWKPDERLVFGAEGIPVEGIGAGAEVVWNGRAHVINRAGWRATLAVNGHLVDSHVLVSGDRFQVGRSRFRYE